MKLNGKTIGFNIFITTIIILASYELSGVVIIPLILSKQFFMIISILLSLVKMD